MGDIMGNHAIPPQPQQPQAPAPSLPQVPQFSQPQVFQQPPVTENVMQQNQNPITLVGDVIPPQPSAPNMFKMQKGKSKV